MKKEAREDYEAQILELRTTLKECKDLLAKEQLERVREDSLKLLTRAVQPWMSLQANQEPEEGDL